MRSARWRSAAVALVAVFLLGGCRTTAQFAPSLPQVVGLQVQGDQLQLLTGTVCSDVTQVTVLLNGGPDDRPARAILKAPVPTAVQTVSVGGRVEADGFEATEGLEPDVDWRDYSDVEVVLDRPSGPSVASSDLEPVKKAGAKHEGDGTAYVRDEGWLTPDQITAGNAKDFLTACTPDPAKKSG